MYIADHKTERDISLDYFVLIKIAYKKSVRRIWEEDDEQHD